MAPADISSLPVELLEMILEESKDPGFKFGSDRWIIVDGKTAKNPIPFPFNFARVCARWRDVMGRQPKYWTYLPIVVDGLQPTPLSELAHYVQLSQELDLEVEVFRTDEAASEGGMDDEETFRAQAAIEILKPHFHRCVRVVFEVLHNTSLPSPSQDFTSSPNLRDVFLNSFHKNATSIVHPVRSTFTAFPNLNRFSLHGQAFFDVVTSMPIAFPPDLGCVELAKYQSSSLDPESGRRFLTALTTYDFSAPSRLVLEDIDVGSIPPFPLQSIRACELQLTAVTNSTLRRIFPTSLANITELSLFGCDLTGLPSPSLNCRRLLIVKSTGDPDIVIAGWNIAQASRLGIYNCPGFNNKTIRSINSRFNQRLYSNLTEISISDCCDFSPKMLLRLAKTIERHQYGCVIRVYGKQPTQTYDEEMAIRLNSTLCWYAGPQSVYSQVNFQP